MKYLTVDFGSTFTKLAAIDSEQGRIVATSSAFTTIETDIVDGFDTAFARLKEQTGDFIYDRLLCCSSAGGGLKMVALGLVPELTAKAAKMAATSAGAKVIKAYAFEISRREQEEIYEINPDLVLLCGGTDGGNKDVIIANARLLCEIERDFAVIVAGNKSAEREIERIFAASDKDFVITDNVMPVFNRLNTEPAKDAIRNLFIRKIVEAKGLSRVQALSSQEIIPTPLAVLMGCELLSRGTKHSAGIGEFMAVDLGGATTDVYSMSSGKPAADNIMEKGLPEPYAKRTVEGDLGMRYSLPHLVEEIDLEVLAAECGVQKEHIEQWISKCIASPDTVAQAGSVQAKIETALARKAVETAVERHCGVMERSYTPMGEIFTLSGKDLTSIPYIIGIGGAIINSDNPSEILEGAKYNAHKFNSMKPKNPKYLSDEKYIFASMGLLSLEDAELALEILKNEIKAL